MKTRRPILVVEDVPDTLELIKVTLNFNGYEVITARNGEEALKIIQRQRPALIITDVLMPYVDGFSLVQRIRLDPTTRNIPVVFLSATYIAPEDKEFAASIGVTRFLEKPIVMDEFLRTVKELLSSGLPADSKPLEMRKFYHGYRQRLENKLKQKLSQIARTEAMMAALSEQERQAFQATLEKAREERDEIQALLEQIRRQLEESA